MLVLIIDDDAVVRDSIRLYLEDCSFDVLEAEDGFKGLERIRNDAPDVVLMDLRMPRMDGLELLGEVKKAGLQVPIIVVSGTGEIRDAVESLRRGAWDFVTKPIHDMAVLEHAIRKAKERTELLEERERYKQRLEEEVRNRTEELVYANERLKSEVSERLCTELELKEAIEDVKAANMAKSRFLSSMSHELRTPLNSIIGLTDMILAGEGDNHPEYVSLVNIAGRELMAIVDNLLDLSAIESGKVDLRESDFNLPRIIEELLEAFAPQAGWKKVSLLSTISPGTPEDLRGDESRLRQILSNLLINAIKTAREGNLDLFVGVDPHAMPREQAETVRLHFSIRGVNVADSGEDSESGGEILGRSVGNGLGVSISKDIIVKMGGDIWVENDGGNVNTIHFTASFKPTEVRKTRDPKVRSELPHIRGTKGPLSILVAEDDPINQKLTEHFFKAMGHGVTVVNNGRAVLEMLRREGFDLVLMDIQMPDMDGIRATRAIRDGEAGDKNRALPIIAMTAHAMKGDRERVLQAGMDGYLAKPVDLETLVRSIEQVMNPCDS